MVKILYVTVVKNNYNGLVKTMNSINNQTYPHITHFIINGGDDKQTNILLGSSIDKVQSISSPDSGLYDAMNKWHQVQGEFDLVCWINSGDCLPHKNTSQIVAGDFSIRRWSWLYGNMRLVSQEQDFIQFHRQVPFSRSRFIYGIRWIPHQSAYFQYTFLKEIGDYLLDVGVGADQEFMMRAARHSTPATLDEVLVDFENGGIHTSLRGWRRQKSWQHFRTLNGNLLLNSKSLDSLLLPILLVIEKFPMK